ncbi:MAG: sulfatase-like hydrolase/transferase, partial [Opitutales bacterium]|nr:sulfatase-like hydrolase/transferase [Opitutales bacterium]
IERNKDRPFFVHLEHFAVHDPIQGRKDLVEKYQKKLARMPKQKGPEYILEPNPDSPALSADKLKALGKDDRLELHQDKRVWWVKQKQDNVEFAGMLEATDESLGRIRAKLTELGLAENTIVIFTADNGGMSASNQYRGVNHPRKTLDSRFASSNLPLRGAKGWNYEGGVRVPLIVHWPGHTEANTISHAVITGTDHYPTLLEMMGLPLLPKQHVDGRSFVPALKGRAHDRGAIYWHFPHYSNHGYQSPGGAIRLGNYKLLEYYENGSVQLFDLKNDLGEQNDLSKEKPVTARKLLKMLHDWRREVDAKMPQLKTIASRKPKAPSAVGTNLPADVATFAPGWGVRDWGGPAMKPGLRTQWDGRKKVLLTHPLSKTAPCVLSRKVAVPQGKKTTLDLEVTNHPKGNWKLVVRLNGKEALSKDIEETKWQQLQVDLGKYAGTTVNIELENRATGWSHEAAYWSRIEVTN